MLSTGAYESVHGAEAESASAVPYAEGESASPVLSYQWDVEPLISPSGGEYAVLDGVEPGE